MKFKTAILRITLIAGVGLLALGYGLFLKSPKPASPPAPYIPITEPALGEKVVRLAQLSPEPVAGEIVQAMDPRNIFVNYEFDGSMRKGGTVVPFKLRFKDGRQFYTFQEPWRKIQMTGRGANSVLEEFPLGSAIKVAPGHRPGSLPENDLEPDDLFFTFLDWPKKVKQPNEETVKTRKCWVVDLYNDQKVGEYGIVRIFVDKESGGLMRMQGYDFQGQMIKVLSVTSGMKVDGATVLKSMDVIRYISGTKKVAGETTFELKKP